MTTTTKKISPKKQSSSTKTHKKRLGLAKLLSDNNIAAYQAFTEKHHCGGEKENDHLALLKASVVSEALEYVIDKLYHGTFDLPTFQRKFDLSDYEILDAKSKINDLSSMDQQMFDQLEKLGKPRTVGYFEKNECCPNPSELQELCC